jgi:hypothetical protein
LVICIALEVELGLQLAESFERALDREGLGHNIMYDSAIRLSEINGNIQGQISIVKV